MHRFPADSNGSRARRTLARKRAFDVVVVISSLPVVVPVGFLTAAALSVDVGWRVLFRQERVGLGGRPFKILKFRTMRDDRGADGELLGDSERLTRVGAVVRRMSLDEMPQLLNVLRGDMSLVGPRPLFVRYLPYYSPKEGRRHEVRPGITGLAQTAGRNALGWDERLALDVEYVESLSLRRDMLILARTVVQALVGADVDVVAGESGEPLDVLRSYPATDRFGIRAFTRRDIPARVEWMRHSVTREHMRLPDDVDERMTLAWYRANRAQPNRHDLVVYEIATRTPRAMLGLKRKQGAELPEMYVFVDPEFIGHGVGLASMELLFRWMASSGAYRGCALEVGADNRRAVSLYERFGFRTEPLDEPGRLRMSLTLEQWSGREDRAHA